MNEKSKINDIYYELSKDPERYEKLKAMADDITKAGGCTVAQGNRDVTLFLMMWGLQLGLPICFFVQKAFRSKKGGPFSLDSGTLLGLANEKEIFKGPISYEFIRQAPTSKDESQGDEGKIIACVATGVLTKTGQKVSQRITLKMVEEEAWNRDKKGEYGVMKSKWNTMPERMFQLRASAWLIRTYAPEVAFGMYERDEVEDFDEVEVAELAKEQDEALSSFAKTLQIKETPSEKEEEQEEEKLPSLFKKEEDDEEEIMLDSIKEEPKIEPKVEPKVEPKPEPIEVSSAVRTEYDPKMEKYIAKTAFADPEKRKVLDDLIKQYTKGAPQAEWTTEQKQKILKVLGAA